MGVLQNLDIAGESSSSLSTLPRAEVMLLVLFGL